MNDKYTRLPRIGAFTDLRHEQRRNTFATDTCERWN